MMDFTNVEDKHMADFTLGRIDAATTMYRDDRTAIKEIQTILLEHYEEIGRRDVAKGMKPSLYWQGRMQRLLAAKESI